ncbi:SAV_2336 N-terminal domain-related protein [Streptomyces acidiscabies]|uniref:SAV_2336 N-terminal domain-related protein n=1 Tax=Streptomyces acidiscabies TaxID=42234 RepID=A0AAP6EJC6_9ACTN|nr:SAV_2336 N-terminal domain-related protein [Streptomyces acidiscabies]MBP5935372.1 hypothetical protein [Streptomyces sp. LBUM 1476]MBZ3916784.1 hypothetical protein [Streptomyces acidiscabies]MDX2964385.1 SAV_2336 N-terminal domain-related protein [Streptomyces acidiscabies]MDX3022934.1 SAV_2336 N-terminal domain-related protein [Streptomyces acidiscabies]MDX3794208.1 SAV_2336 N-terminal domain-related protein [Streptomyces acidiscabies]
MNTPTTTPFTPDLHLVLDAGPTMAVWRPHLRALRQALARRTALRAVTVSVLEADGTLRGNPGDDSPATLVVSDCSGPQWYPGSPGTRWYTTLRRWAGTRPFAVLQPLPEHLWDRTALPGVVGRISAPVTGALNPALCFTPADGTVQKGPGQRTPVPVLELSWLRNWYTLISTQHREIPGSIAFLPHEPVTPDCSFATADLSAEELVHHFVSTASPDAVRFAGHLAVSGSTDLPAMRRMHQLLDKHPQPAHLAEVILSGLLRAVGPPGSYAFRDGVRPLLLRTVPRTSAARTRDLLT